MTAVDETTEPILSQSNAVGQGFDIYGTVGQDSLITPLFDLAASGYRPFTFLGKEWRIPADVLGTEDTRTYFTGTTAETRNGVQASLAAHLNVNASYGAFSGEFQSDFSGEYLRSSEYTFSYQSLYAQVARLQLVPDPQYLRAEFTDRLHELPPSFSVADLPTFEDFFNSFGVFYTAEVTLGAHLGFWIATAKTASLTRAEVSMVLKAQYDGLFSSGSISSSVKASTAWKSYSARSQVGIQAVGADPAKGAAVAALDPWRPSADSVAAYRAWIGSIATDPAVVDFRLRGVWELCGPRRKAVQEAWTAYGRSMRPSLAVTTSTTLRPPPRPTPPAVSLGRLVEPAAPPEYNVGYQAIVLDGNRDITQPAAVLFDRYYSIDNGNWPATYEAMYGEMARDLKAAPLQTSGNILVLAGFNLNWDAVPTPAFLQVMRAAGAGDQLTHWIDTADPGSRVGTPANIVMVGILGQGIGSAVEAMTSETWSDKPIPAQLNVLLFRNSTGSGYTLSEN
ncbi:MAC/perforin domain-containing protein [Actinomadura flavalba]|uniref:MAC/perforin domain-containing protein n=1 Tax=Actinomadura flavalba TaxID=1120938 RepID=UPI000375415D|nr:MAC/perforin domain-containing protein [Actinomadura flavalba]